MASAPLPWLRYIGLALRTVLLGAVLFATVFPLLGWIGSSIPRNSPAAEVTGGVEILVETNGTHTGIVMPVVTPDWDWRDLFPSAAATSNGQAITHVSVGWGEREVFLHVPTWGDLKTATALRIAVTGGNSVMRVSHYVRPAPGENHRPVTISREAYLRMASAIAESLAPAEGEREILRGTNPSDAYYDARGHYTLANTCNSWVGDMLAQAGIQMGLWTPFAGGVMKWIEVPEAS